MTYIIYVRDLSQQNGIPCACNCSSVSSAGSPSQRHREHADWRCSGVTRQLKAGRIHRSCCRSVPLRSASICSSPKLAHIGVTSRLYETSGAMICPSQSSRFDYHCRCCSLSDQQAAGARPRPRTIGSRYCHPHAAPARCMICQILCDPTHMRGPQGCRLWWRGRSPGTAAHSAGQAPAEPW